jgi:Flp pilus assembly protein TadD
MSRLPAALLALSTLAACATTGEGASQDAGQTLANAPPARVDRQARERIGREDMLTQMAFWAAEYQTFPNDIEAARRFADALRKGARNDRAAQIAQEALARFPDDRDLMHTYALAQIANGRPADALQALTLIARAEPENWRVRSALGAAYDQLGRFDEARASYAEALAIQPNEPRVLTNIGVSHIMAGEAEEAEAVLRQATAVSSAPPEARQNLAIALALQGRFEESEQVSRTDLTAAQAASNTQYLRGLLADPRRWGDVGRGG